MIISSRQSMKEGFGREHATGDQCPSLEKKWKAKRNGKQSLSLTRGFYDADYRKWDLINLLTMNPSS